jgi:hypothetical protein
MRRRIGAAAIAAFAVSFIVTDAGVDVTERFVYQRLWRGLSMRSSAAASTLAALRGVRAVFPVLRGSPERRD